MTINYQVPLENIDEAIPAHVEWLTKNYKSGLFLASGRQEPRTGGVVFATGSRQQVESAVSQDPFFLLELATHSIIDFRPSMFGGAFDTNEIRELLG